MSKNLERTNSTLLIVDDEPVVLALLRMALKGRGFDVLLASSGREAIQLYRQSWREIGLVLLDVRMPSMDGVETLEALREVNPEVCCCFMTGDSGRYTVQHLLQHGAAGVFFKPFQLGVLVQTLRDLLTSCDSSADRAQPVLNVV